MFYLRLVYEIFFANLDIIYPKDHVVVKIR